MSKHSKDEATPELDELELDESEGSRLDMFLATIKDEDSAGWFAKWHGYITSGGMREITAWSKVFTGRLRWLEEHQGKVSGVQTGVSQIKAAVFKMICVCHQNDCAPPRELAIAAYFCMGLDKHDWPTRLPGHLDTLTSYYLLNPGASKRQAAKDTGLARDTVRKYVAHADWDIVKNIKEAEFTLDELKRGEYDRKQIEAILNGLN